MGEGGELGKGSWLFPYSPLCLPPHTTPVSDTAPSGKSFMSYNPHRPSAPTHTPSNTPLVCFPSPSLPARLSRRALWRWSLSQVEGSGLRGAGETLGRTGAEGASPSHTPAGHFLSLWLGLVAAEGWWLRRAGGWGGLGWGGGGPVAVV